ncbi:hypothetical protein [Pedobacter sp. JY14-1]|uniref:hypothetical protein n=1 Tax=Pedobacter sp. JY14-1 TaxID=3034151 RepID=UPI0023E18B74|nr:hypothetical protein [Pedobacter sp. JY14-1]
MGFIKDAIIGIAIYEGIKVWIRQKERQQHLARQITLGGKGFKIHRHDPAPNLAHRHNLDRPEIPVEL